MHLLRPLALLPVFVALLAPLSNASAQESGAATATTAAATEGREVWSATMTVGTGGGLRGYGTFSGRAVGALSGDAFSWRDRAYTVTTIVYDRSGRDAESRNVVIDFLPALPEGIDSLTVQVGDRWLNLADARGNSRQFFWYGIDLDWRHGQEVPVSLREFPQGFEARSIDSRGNNRDQPELGMAETKLLRLAGVSYEYGRSALPSPDLPGARFISNIVSDQSEPAPNAAEVTDMVWQWGQFLDHDISFTPVTDRAETLRIAVPRGDPVFDPRGRGRGTIAFTRSAYDPSTGTGPDNPREQVTEITAFIDASSVYGSDRRRTSALRTNDGTGKLNTSGAGRFLPYHEDGFENDGGNERRDLFFGGDIRVNEQVGLTALHTLFVREHNRLADLIASAAPAMNGHEIFELARKIVGAQKQVITYDEFLPTIPGPAAIGPYRGYDRAVDPAIATEFSTAAYRFGHTLLSPSLLLIDADGGEGEVWE